MAALVFLIPLLAGCLNGAVDSGRGANVDPAYETFLYVPQQPVALNGTASGDALTYYAYQQMTQEECPFRGAAFGDHRYNRADGVINLFDRQGRIYEQYYVLNPDNEITRFEIQLIGEPPYLFMGLTGFCNKAHNGSRIVDVDGFRANWSKTVVLNEYIVPVTVPLGETTTEITWTAPPNTYGVKQAWANPQGNKGERYGNITLYGPDGTLLRYDAFTPLGYETDTHSLALPADSYTIRLELMLPARERTVWPYGIGTLEAAPGVCDYGFEWEGLCT